MMSSSQFICARPDKRLERSFSPSTLPRHTFVASQLCSLLDLAKSTLHPAIQAAFITPPPPITSTPAQEGWLGQKSLTEIDCESILSPLLR